MKKKRLLGIAASAALALGAVLMLPSSAEAGKIKNRAENQQDRIAKGIGNGSLTARESSRLERRETHLNREVHDMRKDNGGTLTDKEKGRVNAQQNRISKGIYDQKHDGQSQGTPSTEVGQRKENQQDRIAQGVNSGELNARETSRLEGKETAVNQETRDMRALNGGKLSPADKAVVNKQQDKVSKQIYDQKHDAQTQPQ
jgi:hypothetical protein